MATIYQNRHRIDLLFYVDLFIGFLCSLFVRNSCRPIHLSIARISVCRFCVENKAISSFLSVSSNILVYAFAMQYLWCV